MVKGSHKDVEWGDCGNPECDEQTPWDMIGIIADGEVYCSPLCVHEALDEPPEDVWLHDPQFTVDRGPLRVDSRVVDLQPPYVGFEAIEQINDLVDVDWRL